MKVDDCKSPLANQVLFYLNEDLSERQVKRVRVHLRECGACQGWMEFILALRENTIHRLGEKISLLKEKEISPAKSVRPRRPRPSPGKGK